MAEVARRAHPVVPLPAEGGLRPPAGRPWPHVGQATGAKAYRLLARLLGAAVEARYLAVNPCGTRRAASEGAPEMRIATIDQVAVIAGRVPPRYRALVLVAAFGGLRWGEPVGLRRLGALGSLRHSVTTALAASRQVASLLSEP
jgi:integrase